MEKQWQKRCLDLHLRVRDIQQLLMRTLSQLCSDQTLIYRTTETRTLSLNSREYLPRAKSKDHKPASGLDSSLKFNIPDSINHYRVISLRYKLSFMFIFDTIDSNG